MKEEYSKSTDDIHFSTVEAKNSKAILVGVFKSNDEKTTAEDHLNELDLLAKTHKIDVISRFCTLVREFSATTFLSAGKLDQLKEMIENTGATLVIFDDEISPVQQRNLEQLLKMVVMDRTEVILGVFADRARTREAKLQIEVAQVKYLAPRLKRMWLHLSRQAGSGGGAGGGAYLRGKGEKQIEMDRRALKRRLERLEKELKEVSKYRLTQRHRRERQAVPVFAIVGYTNAGKSTLMNHLTKAGVLVEDMLFATLDTTTRKFTLPNHQHILMVDTVGFIRKLPHLLVAAFKSTLEEAVDADILLHIVDSSHPLALEQANTTMEVIKELNATDRPIITVINKIDLRMKDTSSAQIATMQKLRMSYPKSVQVSAVTGEGFPELFTAMIDAIKDRRKNVVLRIPQSDYGVVSSMLMEGRIISKEYDENDIIIQAELPLPYADQLSKYAVLQGSE